MMLPDDVEYPPLNPAIPVLTSYRKEFRSQIAMPLGGIGTGTISLGGRGDLRDWEVRNRPEKGNNGKSLFVLYARENGKTPVVRALEGVLSPPFDGPDGAVQPFPGVPRFRNAEFHAAYPFAQVVLSDPSVPVSVRLEAFNPLVPADSGASGLPMAVLRYVVFNRTDNPVSTTVCGSIANFIADGSCGSDNPRGINSFYENDSIRGFLLHSAGIDSHAEDFGTMAVATSCPEVTHCDTWPNGSLAAFWQDLQEDGKLDCRDSGQSGTQTASLAAQVQIPPGETRTITFYICWHFPNRMSWEMPTGEAAIQCCGMQEKSIIGNYYATQYADARDVLTKTWKLIPELEARSLRFVSAFCESPLPAEVLEAALFNLSTLRTQTCFRAADGSFFGWEGCGKEDGCCGGSCTHVWNYEQATAFLFGDLARGMRETEFELMTDDEGFMSFRVCLPTEQSHVWDVAAADGQTGCIMKLYREWQLSGDDEMLKRLWPKAKKAMEFCWIEGGWDADRDGVMEGCQHNTLDIEYYGPNPLMAGWYLGALRAAEQMSGYLGETAFAQTCRELFARGSGWIDANLFNGEYYEHQIRPPGKAAVIDPRFQFADYERNLENPDYQLGAGCLVDQLAGQMVAHICGLGHLLDRAHIRETLSTLMRHNYRDSMFGHFNDQRGFAVNEEAGLVLVSYPRGGRPRTPVSQLHETMTGCEYTAAVNMLFEDLNDDGLKCIRAIRSRYDGKKRNPFDEAECGHHYARAMASWGAVIALSGFHFSAVAKRMTFSRKAGKYFWSNGYAWGVCGKEDVGDGIIVSLSVEEGILEIVRFCLTGVGERNFGKPAVVSAGKPFEFKIDY